jgi:hypothetical protein
MLVVGEAGVVIRADGFKLHVEGRAHERLVLLQHAHEFAAVLRAHWIHRHEPGVHVHEDGGTFAVRYEIVREVQTGA